VSVRRDGRDVDGLSTHRRIGTGAIEDSFVTEAGGIIGWVNVLLSSGMMSENVESK